MHICVGSGFDSGRCLVTPRTCSNDLASPDACPIQVCGYANLHACTCAVCTREPALGGLALGACVILAGLQPRAGRGELGAQLLKITLSGSCKWMTASRHPV